MYAAINASRQDMIVVGLSVAVTCRTDHTNVSIHLNELL
jgi:hypothetical protein